MKNKGQSKLTRLLRFVQDNDLSYDQSAKDKFKERGLEAMKRLASALKLREFKADFNAGGIAVSGDIHLMGMFNDTMGIYITITKGVFNHNGCTFLYRTIKNMEDYSGGGNNYFREIVSEIEVVKKIHALCRINPEQQRAIAASKSLSKRNVNPIGKPLENFTGNKRKDFQARYDKAYKLFQDHLAYGNYFQLGAGSHDRIHDLTIAALAFDNLVNIKGQMTEEGFLRSKFIFPSSNEGTPTALIGCYRSEMWNTFGHASNKYVLIEEEEN
ncbi:MAG TPA: hypothetical protein VMX17_17405 [Candidatus Glassbacteria bacterium]|nr:hypothetical protein [Candidatus Glassbacteria bacterium]